MYLSPVKPTNTIITEMTLEELGYNPLLEAYRVEHGLQGFETGRITAEHRERWVVLTARGELEAEITGNMRFTARGREDLPAVGDWVALTVYDADFAIIHSIFPRSSVLRRQEVSHNGEIQILAVNVDTALLVQAADRDFNINRLERYLTICHSFQVKPLIVLSKIDLITPGQLDELLSLLRRRIPDVAVIPICNHTREGYPALDQLIEKGKTFCLLGSSGVGKSTLLNHLSGRQIMATGRVSDSSHKGRHITSHRELVVLDNGALLIDNPGMREVGIADTGHGLEAAFQSIALLARNCKFKDCTHRSEAGCAVIGAVAASELDAASYENYLKMEREKAHFEMTDAQRRKKDKGMGKILKNYYKERKDNL